MQRHTNWTERSGRMLHFDIFKSEAACFIFAVITRRTTGINVPWPQDGPNSTGDSLIAKRLSCTPEYRGATRLVVSPCSNLSITTPYLNKTIISQLRRMNEGGAQCESEQCVYPSMMLPKDERSPIQDRSSVVPCSRH